MFILIPLQPYDINKGMRIFIARANLQNRASPQNWNVNEFFFVHVMWALSIICGILDCIVTIGLINQCKDSYIHDSSGI